jgi:hypothetical protein
MTLGWISCCAFQPQSGTAEGHVNLLNSEYRSQNVRFKDRVKPYEYAVETHVDETRTSQDSDMAPLGDFLMRPIKIAEYEWSNSTTLSEGFNPWSLFFTNDRIINRIANFHLLRCKLKLRVLINGNAFQYGRALMYYRPLANFDELSTDSALIRQDLIQGSQCPHIYLDPNTSQGGSMELPFFWHENYLSIPDGDYVDMGVIYLRSLNALKHANDASDRVTITVMAWAEDVQLSVLTSVNPVDITPQSGEVVQANTKGWISGPATMVAQIAGALRSIPAIAPYATATQMGAKALAKMATIFGYCKPTITKAPEPYRPTTTSTLSVTNVPDNSQKLTVDHQQELTIDPSISGIHSLDPLNVLAIAQRESYLTTFVWAVGTSPDSMLWNARPTPTFWDESGSGAATHLTSVAAVSLPFERWTGSLRFRFQIVCSSFHRGRLRIVWDPNYIVDPSSNFNVTNSTIVDIAEERDFTMEVSNGQKLSLLGMLRPGSNPRSSLFSTVPYTTKISSNGIPSHNGVIGVYVLNELTVPNSIANNDISINVFVSAGDDFQLFAPGDYFQRFTFKPQSGEVDPIEENTEEPSAPIQNNVDQVHMASSESDKLTHVFMGEAIASMRPLLKRFTLHNSKGLLSAGDTVIGGSMPAFPYLRGNVAGAINFSATGPYNYCNTTLLQWVTSGFAGWRGSMRWKILPRGQIDTSHPLTMYVGRGLTDSDAPEYTFFSETQDSYPGPNSAASASTVSWPYGVFSAQIPPPGATGTAFTHSLVNPTLEFESPFYSSYRFVPGKIQNYTNSTELIGPYFDYRIYANGSTASIMDFWSAAGDDFQVYFWTGMPRMYYEPLVPAP